MFDSSIMHEDNFLGSKREFCGCDGINFVAMLVMICNSDERDCCKALQQT